MYTLEKNICTELTFNKVVLDYLQRGNPIW